MKNHMVVHYKFDADSSGHIIKNYFVDHKIDFQKSVQLENEFKNTTFENTIDNIYNVEDLSFHAFKKYEIGTFNTLQPAYKPILIMRDPYNFIASCLQRLVDPPDALAGDVGKQLPARLKVWKEHARQVLHQSETSDDVYFINFNEWFKSEAYRKKICEDLGLVFTDNGVNKVMNFGSGSSFDREKFDGKAQNMGVLTRYLKWKDNEVFKQMVDDEIGQMGEEIFGLTL